KPAVCKDFGGAPKGRRPRGWGLEVRRTMRPLARGQRRGMEDGMGLKDRTPATREEYEAYRTNLSNWGRWGADDQFGTLNFITTETKAAAASLVRDGRTVSCANPLATRAVIADER